MGTLETVEDRYLNDSSFHDLVNTICHALARGDMTRADVWKAAMLAFAHYDATLDFERGEESP